MVNRELFIRVKLNSTAKNARALAELYAVFRDARAVVFNAKRVLCLIAESQLSDRSRHANVMSLRHPPSPRCTESDCASLQLLLRGEVMIDDHRLVALALAEEERRTYESIWETFTAESRSYLKVQNEAYYLSAECLSVRLDMEERAVLEKKKIAQVSYDSFYSMKMLEREGRELITCPAPGKPWVVRNHGGTCAGFYAALPSSPVVPGRSYDIKRDHNNQSR
ncbi:hypothetical protein TRVL_09370 [Trypanosoma vivax]|nr:hypothetical protein TRVL_09370 [Trypanosoma vivax]